MKSKRGVELEVRDFEQIGRRTCEHMNEQTNPVKPTAVLWMFALRARVAPKI